MQHHSSPYQHSSLSKKKQVTQMFDSVAQRYDLANRILSAGIDRSWRKQLVRMLASYQPKYVLDIATGTGDLVLAICRSIAVTQVLGVDISEKMIAFGKQKIQKSTYADVVKMCVGDGEALEVADDAMDAVTVAFGFRNFENREQGLQEMYRVLKRGGVCLILEFSQPKRFWYRWFYAWYLGTVIPHLGGCISGHREAYAYLKDSIHTFPRSEQVIDQMMNSGFKGVTSTSLSGGICRIWKGEK